MNAEKTPAPETVPQFFWDMMDEAGMQVIAENVVVVYEQGQGGDIVTEIGTLVKPNDTQEAMTPEMLWLMPKDKQTDQLVRMIQINRRFLIEIGSAYANEDSE